jgi:glycosyltransferase involved in cell wall biosynthesis
MNAPTHPVPTTCIVVLAHNEERRITACLASLPLGEPGVTVHVVVNGSSDRTAQYARCFAPPGVQVHEYSEAGKARSWNRFVLDEAAPADTYVFVDGDAQVVPGSVAVLVETLAANPAANAASAMPSNGRGMVHYREAMLRTHGLFGDLYALRGSFVMRMRAAGIRLPDDLIGDDSLIGALAKTDLGNEDDWRDARVIPCPDAGFLCEPRVFSPGSLRDQFQRMVRYSLRHYQNLIVSQIMRGPGPAALPERLATHYREWLPRWSARAHPLWWWADRQAIRRMTLLAEPRAA